MASSMAMLVAPSAEPVFNNRQVVSGYSCGIKPVCTFQNLTCRGVGIYYPVKAVHRFCTDLAGVLYTKTLCCAKEGSRHDTRGLTDEEEYEVR
jgi:hypothetical protein